MDCKIERLRGKRIGLALSGGGARGFAHLGVFRAMEELGIRPDVIAGVSAGSIAAVLYASGMKAAAIAKEFKEATMSDFAEMAIPQNGFFKLTKLKEFLKKRVPYAQLQELPIETIVCATDFDNCCPVAFHEGSISDCVMASCSVPVVFKPVKIGGVTYVDGGVLRNLPAWAIRDKCDVLVGVNVSPLPGKKYKNSLLDIAARAYDIAWRSNANEDVALCDIVIQLRGIGMMNMFDIKRQKVLIQSGYVEAMGVFKKYGEDIPTQNNNNNA